MKIKEHEITIIPSIVDNFTATDAKEPVTEKDQTENETTDADSLESEEPHSNGDVRCLGLAQLKGGSAPNISITTNNVSFLQVKETLTPPLSPSCNSSHDFENMRVTSKTPPSPLSRPRIRKGTESAPNIFGNLDDGESKAFQLRVKNWNKGTVNGRAFDRHSSRSEERLSLQFNLLGGNGESQGSTSLNRTRGLGSEYVEQSKSISISIDKDEEIRILHIEIDKFRAKLSTLEDLVRKNLGWNNHNSLNNISTGDEMAPNEHIMSESQKVNRDRVFINIGGLRHETYRSTLKNIPDTRLSWIAEESATHSPEYDPLSGEFFFDRHPQVFSHILNYYRTGNLHVPYDVCGPLFEEELQYWGIDDSQVESCCWLSYRQHRDAQETLKDFEGIELDKNFDDDSEPDLSKYGFAVGDDNEVEKVTWYRKWQPVMWKLMEEPRSSKKAKVIAYISMSLIMLSVVLSCLETVKYFKDHDQRKLVLLVLEGCCVFYFSIELATRFVFCPSKKQFLKGVLNWIDLMAILPFLVQVVMQYGLKSSSHFSFFIQSIRVIRVFRIIKLSKHHVGLQILGHTLKASFRELILLIFFLIIGVVIFSSLVYYCERDDKGTKFVSIPETFWWAVITMTTVGYGDMVPMTALGKFVGAICSVCGVLMIALPVPVIVNNFNLYYSHAQARLKLPKKKRRVLVGAPNALKVEDVNRLQSSSETLNNDNNNENGSAGSDTEDQDKFAALRMKRFSRRDSNMFGSNPNPSPQTMRNGDIAVIHKSRNSTYAMSKRRSLLPTIPTLPEIEQ